MCLVATSSGGAHGDASLLSLVQPQANIHFAA
jgi:hypothetical protein